MPLTIELHPQLEAEIREQAARAGLDPGTFIRKALEECVRQGESPSKTSPSHLSAAEADLLQKINQGLPPEVWERYHELVAKRRAETLTPDEHTNLIELSDRIEVANARRLEHLVELARLRQISLDTLLDQLGIKAPGYA